MIKIVGSSLFNDKVKIIDFNFKIKNYLTLSEKIFILLEIPETCYFNENIFCAKNTGELLWQVEKIEHIYEDSPYDGIQIKNGNLIGRNYDSFDYLIDENTGRIVSKIFTK